MWLRSSQPSQQKPRIEIGLSRKDQSRASCLTERISTTYVGDPQGNWGWHTGTHTASLDWRSGWREYNTERRLVDLQNSRVRKQADEAPELHRHAPFPEKVKRTPRVQPWAQRVEHEVCRTKLQALDLSQDLKFNGISLAGLWSGLRLVAPFSFHFPPCLNWNIRNWYPIPVSPLYFRVKYKNKGHSCRGRGILPQDASDPHLI